MFKKIFHFLLVLLFVSLNVIPQTRVVTTEAEIFYVPGSPRGEVSGGVQLRPRGYNYLYVIKVDPRVVWMKIEQNDYVAPEIGPNPNEILFNGNPNSVKRLPRFDLSNIHSLQFIIRTSGNKRISQAVKFQWVRGKK